MSTPQDQVAVFVCRGDLEQQWAQSICDTQRREHEDETDSLIERRLGQHPQMDGHFEEADVELVPIDWAEAP